MRSPRRPKEEYRTDYIVAFDTETLQPPADPDDAHSGAFRKWPHHRPLVASFLTAAAESGGTWAFSVESVIFEEGREADALRNVEDLLPNIGTVTGHNSRSFDAPVLALTAQAARVHLPKLARLCHEPRFGGAYHADTMDLFTNHRAAQAPSLAELCERIGIPCKLDVAGGDVQSLHEQGRIETVVNYCEQDATGALLIYLSAMAFKHADERLIVEPLAAFSSWVSGAPNLAHLLPFATCDLAKWARGRSLVHQLERATCAVETKLQRETLKREVSEVIHF